MRAAVTTQLSTLVAKVYAGAWRLEMANDVVEYRVFVASPNEVSEERRVVEEVVAELNSMLRHQLSARLQVVGWEHDSYPAFGTDPQDVINQQLGNDHDIFVGIFWSRIGTPTPRSESGTVEEFEAALNRFRESGRPRVLLYFKNAAIEPSRIDVQQLKALQEFKASVSGLGGLYWEFENRHTFESSLRTHLSDVFHELVNGNADPAAEITVTEELGCQEEALDDDYGYLDYMEIARDRMSDMGTATTAIADATVEIGANLQSRSSEMAGLANATPAKARRLLMRTAEDLSRYADIVGIQIPVLSESRVIGLDALSKAIALRSDFDNAPDEIAKTKAQLTNLRKSTAAAGNAMSGMRDSANRLPRISSEINRAKRSVVTRLDSLLSELDTLDNAIANILGHFN
jgi:hypothetical protein